MTAKDLETVNPLLETDPDAQRHIAKVQAEHNAQYLALRRRAQGLFAAIKGQTGIRTPHELDKVFEKTAQDFDSGSFLVERLGVSRFLDPQLTCVLLRLRGDLLSAIQSPTAADMMHADMAVLAYRNVLRIQSLVCSSLMETERQLFGQLSLDAVLGTVEAAEASRILGEVEQKLMPMLERCQRVLNRSLDRLSPSMRTRRTASSQVNVGFAGQVNVKS